MSSTNNSNSDAQNIIADEMQHLSLGDDLELGSPMKVEETPNVKSMDIETGDIDFEYENKILAAAHGKRPSEFFSNGDDVIEEALIDDDKSINPHFSYTEEQMLKDQDAKIRAFNTLASSPRNSRSSSASSFSGHGRRPSVIVPPVPPTLSITPKSSKVNSKFSYNPTTHEITPKSSLSPSIAINPAAAQRDPTLMQGKQKLDQLKSEFSHEQNFKLGSILANDHNISAEEAPSIELVSLYKQIKWCLDTRKKYQDVSIQNPDLNPKNSENWKIYPSPPSPFWKAQNNRQRNLNHRESSKENNYTNSAVFDFEKCDIPGPDESTDFVADNEDTYQIISTKTKEKLINVPTIRDYYMDLDKIVNIASDGPMKSFAFKRLQYLEARWNLYHLLNDHAETSESKRNPHRDFYNVRKVDVHVHHSACMNQKHLLRFIKHKIRHCPDEKVIKRDGQILTLQEVFDSLNLTAYDLSIDTLDMHAHRDTFHRFDKFNLKYNPIGESRLREIFLKTDNFIQGRYLAEITREVFDDLESSKYQMAEYRISIYGRSEDEWDKLAAWVVDNKLFSHNVRWLIQVPRLYNIYKKGGLVQSFKDIIDNLFRPLFEVTKNPQSHPKLFIFLQRVIGFDSVDDESKIDRRFYKKFPFPSKWESENNPPYSYYLYYIFSNLTSLNHWRKNRGFNTFVLRPHSGEAGDPEHLIAAYLTSESISHGILLRKVPFVQYLYYLCQIGIAMSPLSNNALFLTYDKNPFPAYFKRGLNVALSTDDPLQFSYTREPLIEEYSVAAQIWKLSNVDMSELAKNSVKMSGFEYELKKHWIGHEFTKVGIDGNDIEKTNVPDIRVAYRTETLQTEHELIEYYNSIEGV
ncbi:hypothetical protein CANINC_003153 [Pichia inconspicua]|uniref:AMP deaminase n=1 Tax=Pichia inconspicua TaxID=52247 RepID=A0A4T0WZH7_9ASCO|nr:hypothetical protein CANINC_003153 [[Candida] inconspicua]